MDGARLLRTPAGGLDWNQMPPKPASWLEWRDMDIFTAVERKNLRELKRILAAAPGAARTIDCWGRTALMLACVEGEARFVELLLPWSDAAASDRDGVTALMLAAFGHPRCVELLLPVSDPLARDTDGWTALMWAASSGSEQCVTLLLPHSDATAATDSGMTALDIARKHDQLAQAQQIRRHLVAQGDASLLSAPVRTDNARMQPLAPGQG